LLVGVVGKGEGYTGSLLFSRRSLCEVRATWCSLNRRMLILSGAWSPYRLLEAFLSGNTLKNFVAGYVMDVVE